MSPRDARDRYLDHRRTDASESSVKSWHYRLKHFVEWAEENGLDDVRDLDGWTIDEYETHRRSAGISAVTLNAEMQTLTNWLEYLARIEVVDADLPERVHVPKVPDGEDTNDELLEQSEAYALIQSFRETPSRFGIDKHAVFELLWFTGCRLGAARSLDLRDYDSDEHYVEFRHRPELDTPLKNDSDGERAVGLPPSVCDVLDEYIEEYRIDSHDDHGRQPLFTTVQGRPAENTLRVWCYLATQPCLHEACPHGMDRDTCDFVHVHHASKCPSSVSPHRVRTGSITWQRDMGLPAEIVAERVDATLEVIESYYDKATARQRLEKRRRPYISDLELES